jgi:hypothetical protein
MVGLDSVVCHEDEDDVYRDSADGSGGAEYGVGVAVLLTVGTGKGRASRDSDDAEYPVPCNTVATGLVGGAAVAAATIGRLTGSGRELHGMVIPEGNVVVVP